MNRCRIAHITDLHLQVQPDLSELASKRLIGAVNLYLFGRQSHFQRGVTEALIGAVSALSPDALICSGDLTALATPAEFRLARDLLSPLFSRQPSLVIPGNHDVYTAESAGRFGEFFGTWAVGDRSGDGAGGDRGAGLPGLTLGGMRVVGLDVCAADWASRGYAGAGLARLAAELDSGTAPLGLMLHYPLRDRRGQPYGPWTRALRDADAVERLLAHPRAAAVFHGHEHHGYTVPVPAGDRTVQSFNPGAGGYAFLPEKRRTAHFCVYTAEGGRITDVARYAFDGERFGPEAGGAWAGGR